MALDGNYSTLNRANSYFSFQEGISSRILVGISAGNYAAGITAGDVIRWDTTSQQYEKSKANTPYTAEVFGIVESYSAGDLYVVVNGSINLNPDKTIIRSSDNTGGNDVFFLSGNNLGFIENVGPTFAGYVIKPIYQVAPHGNFTGIVRNYLGYRTNVSLNTDPDVFGEIISFSDDMSRMISYSPNSQTFYINTLSYSNNTFTRTTVQSFSKNDVPPVTFLLDNTHDCKVSNNGKDVLIFSKSNNKIYYINLDTGTPILKQTLSLDVVGSVEDKIWACDDELSCMTISTRSLERAPNIYDSRVTSHDVSSKIKYFKRNMNNTSPYKWRQTFEHHAFGYCDSTPREYSTGGPVDSLNVTSGVYRTNDIKCHKKHFCLSTICLLDDQIQYNSKITGYFSPRYNNINKGATAYSYSVITELNGSGITIESVNSRAIFFGQGITLLEANPTKDTSIHRSYECGFGFKNYRILTKDNNYYYEDYSHKDNSGIEYFAPQEHGGSSPPVGSNSRRNTNPYPSSDLITATPGTSIEASVSKTCSTDSFIFCCYRYGTQIGVYKFPFLSSDQINTFRYFEENNTGSTVPSTTGYGLILNTNSLNLIDFNFFATDSVYFICGSDKTFINGVTQISTENFNKANFYNTTNGIFFKVFDKIFKYNSTTQNFDLQGIL